MIGRGGGGRLAGACVFVCACVCTHWFLYGVFLSWSAVTLAEKL